ncbi:MAG: glycine cleavage T C-terminal barrel domain-containing protein [Pseudomonadota bacterium]
MSSRFHDEYRWATERAALFERRDRALLAVAGNDRTRFLQAMLTNDVKRLPVGHHLPACLLDAKGRIRAVLRILNRGDLFWIETGSSEKEKLREILEKHVIADDVAISGLPDLEVWTLLGPTARELFPASPGSGACGEFPVGTGSACVLALATPVDLTFQIYVKHGVNFPGICSAAEIRMIGPEAFDALRIEAGEAINGIDFAEENLLPEIPSLEAYVSYTKGCFLGQELIARLRARGNNVARRMMGLAIPGGEDGPAVGCPVHSGAEEVGRITSLCESPKLGSRLALAMLPRAVFEPGTELTVISAARAIPATVISLPL